MKKLFFILLFLFATNVLAQSVVDIDVDDDGLIEINHLEDLNAMRYQLDGSGLRANATAEKITTGCAVGGCKGYELTRDLDFYATASYRNIANRKLWTTGVGWQPIGDTEHPFSSVFKTNNSSTPNTIFNLSINNSSASSVGLFGHIGSTAEISGVGLLNVEVSGYRQVGGLVGESSGGRISNSYVSGRVVGYGGEVGLLIGRNSGTITNSFSDGEVSATANGSGGLVGANSGAIANSYATGSVVGNANHVGGLVGDNSQGTISNCYTTGTVSGGEDIGGLVGISNLGTLINNYVSGKSSGTRYVGGLVGSNIGGTITHSYWDKTASELESDTGGVGLSASELQSANAQAEDLNKPYYKWSESNWDFGTAEQYPILKYAVGPNSDKPVCGAGQTLPNCGTLLLGQHASLSRIVFLEDIALTPTFKPTQLNYHLDITADIEQLQLIPIASKPDSTIKVSKNGIVIDNTLASGTTSSAITLAQNTEITIEVSATNQRPAQYRLAINYIPTVAITGIPTTAIDEGKTITLDATKSSDTEGDPLTYRWTQTIGKALLIMDRNQAMLSFKIPEDYVAATAANDPLGFTLAVSDGKATINQDINMTINKIDNGSSAIGTLTLNILEWTAPEIDLSADPDGVGNSLGYQWQSRAPDSDADWTDIDKATKPTHALSFLTIPDTAYRVRISYTDGQGYETTRISAVAKYDTEIVTLATARAQASEPETTPTATTPSITVSTVFQCSTNDIDQDDDGLIEICDLEGLNAIRYQMDGTGYRTSTDTTKITTGCKSDGCNGYELTRDLDFNDDASYSSTANKVIYTVDDYEDGTDKGWQPIGYRTNDDDNEPFTSIFEGNGHTISNLMINRPNTDHVGLFGYTNSNSKILNVGLLNVNIEGQSSVGGLVGYSSGNITDSYATGSVNGNIVIGGLVGFSYSARITNSYTTSSVTGDSHVGGLVGFGFKGSITDCYVTGSVKGSNYLGGLAGRNDGSITNSYAIGSVAGNDTVGGLVGDNGGSITNSYAIGSVAGNYIVGGLVGDNGDSITNSYATSSVTGDSYVGGLVGYGFMGSITNSYVTGSVDGNRYVGGLVGHGDYGNITNSYAAGSVDGRGYVGGLVGHGNYGNITNSYAAGSVDGRGYVGGLVGHGNYGNITNSYWDTDTSGILTSAGGTSKTTVELQSPTTATGIYSNWSTDNWYFGTKSQYPVLKYGTACGAAGQPDCGTLLPYQYSSSLDSLALSSNATLSPQFDSQTFDYDVVVDDDAYQITLHTTATGASIRIINNTNGKKSNGMGTAGMTIPLMITTDTKVTIVVDKDYQRPTQYTLTVAYDIGTTPLVAKVYFGNGEAIETSATEITINEGSEFELSFDSVLCHKDDILCEWVVPIPSYLVECETDALSSLPSPSNFSQANSDVSLLCFEIPHNALEAHQSSQSFTVIFAARNKNKDSKSIVREEIKLTIVKQNNDHINLEPLELSGLVLTFPKINLSGDTDGEVQADTLIYQWQEHKGGDRDLNEPTSWDDIDSVTTNTYIIAEDALYAPHYRMQISYTDGQGYTEAIHSPPIRNIDVDNDGLIEINYLEELDAIRYELDGTGYKTSAGTTATKKGCKSGGCNGYELTRNLDFNDDASYSSPSNKAIWTTGAGWAPIGDAATPFDGIFRGNNHTIANLTINRDDNDIGLFAMISNDAKIDGIDLYRVNIHGRDMVGALAGRNGGGTIENLSVDGTVKGSGGEIGGLVGVNERGATITRSYSATDVTGKDDVGGLVGVNWATITDSYATGKIVGNKRVGGLVGYDRGKVIRHSYAIAKVEGVDAIGNLVGTAVETRKIMRSYWNTEINTDITNDDKGEGRSTEQLQSATTPTNKVYKRWNTAVWDFGTTEQYPALKYNGGDLLAGQRLGLQSLELSDGAMLLDDFSNTTYRYDVLAGNKEQNMRLTAIAANPKDEIRLYRDGNDETGIELATTDSKVKLAPGNSTMTIVVRDGRSEVSYTLNITRFEVDFEIHINGKEVPYNEGVTINESSEEDNKEYSEINLKPNLKSKFQSPTHTYRWMQSQVKTLPTTVTNGLIKLTIPNDFVEGDASSSNVVLNLEVTASRGDKQIKSDIYANLTINKMNKGGSTRTLKPPALRGLTLTAANFPTRADIEAEPDGGIDKNNIRYQWQSFNSNIAKWESITDNADISSYEIPAATPNYTEYRIQIIYTDGQGYDHTLVSQSRTYIDIDRDDNGLIDIHTGEQLNAMRYRLSGTGYRVSTATELITAGCAMNDKGDEVCNGYELKAHIDLSSYPNWQPIGSDKPFVTRFEGNNYTVSNLSISTETTVDNAGLFARTGGAAVIRNVGLLNVDINAGNNVGGLVGFNQGEISDSYVVGKVTGYRNVGGLVGRNGANKQRNSSATTTIFNSHTLVGVGDAKSINVGGLAGHNNATIDNSYAVVKRLRGSRNIGGIVGMNEYSDVTNSYAAIGRLNNGDGSGEQCRLSGDGESIDATNTLIGDCNASTLFEYSD